VTLQQDENDRNIIRVLTSISVAFAGGVLLLFGLAILSYPFTLNPHVYWSWFPDFITQPFSLALSVIMVLLGLVLFFWFSLRKKSRKQQLTVLTSAIILLAFTTVVVYPFLFPERPPSTYDSPWIKASANTLTTDKFTMFSEWYIDWAYSTSTHQGSWLEDEPKSELVIVVLDANTGNVVYNFSAYADSNPPYQFMYLYGTFYLSITTPHSADNIVENPWYYTIACHTGLPRLFR
jgi:hypothetical protein